MAGRCQESKGPKTKVCGLILGDSNRGRERPGSSLEVDNVYKDSRHQRGLSIFAYYLLGLPIFAIITHGIRSS